MEKTAAVFPVLPGKDPRQGAKLFRERAGDYAESRARLGVHLERVYEMATPAGTFVIAYVESDIPFGEVAGKLAQSDLEIDHAFVRHAQDIHGVDLTQPPQGRPPEVIADWVDDSAGERKRGLAFCAPLQPDAEDRARSFAREAFERRRGEHTESRRAIGLTHETVVLNHTPQGSVVGVYLEGDDAAGANRRFAESRSEYDVWFKEQCKQIFPPEVDFNQPLPPISTVFDSQELLVAR